MTDEIRHQQNLSYCKDLLRDNAEDIYVSIQFSTKQVRAHLIGLYAFATEIARIPQSVSEPTLGMIRQQWWRDALDEIQSGKTPRAHPVVELCAEFLSIRAENAVLIRLMLEMIESVGEFLEPMVYQDLSAPLKFTDQLYGNLCEAALILSHPQPIGDQERILHLREMCALNALASQRLLDLTHFVVSEHQVETLAFRWTKLLARDPLLTQQISNRAASLKQMLGEISPEEIPLVGHAALIGPYLNGLVGAEQRKRNPFFGVSKRIRILWAVITGRI